MIPERNKYLEALGIPDFLFSSVSNELPNKFKLLVIEQDSEESFCQSGASQDLLFKMLASIGLGLNECKLISLAKSEINRFIKYTLKIYCSLWIRLLMLRVNLYLLLITLKI